MDKNTLIDFDLDITQVILAHYHFISPACKVTAYKNGRKFHGIICALSGSAKYCFSGYAPICLNQGEIAFIPADASYEAHCMGEKPFEHYTINFLGREETFPKWLPRQKMYVLNSSHFASYKVQLQEIVSIWKQHKIGYRMQARARLMAFLAEYLTEGIVQRINPGNYNRILPAKQMIDEQYAEKITLEELAAACNMSLSGFRRAFVENYQQSPGAYLTNLRLEKAKEFLLLGYSLEDTALMTGFSDVNYFIRYFKRKNGITPGQFRNQI